MTVPWQGVSPIEIGVREHLFFKGLSNTQIFSNTHYEKTEFLNIRFNLLTYHGN
jgi:hypothetical protein